MAIDNDLPVSADLTDAEIRTFRRAWADGQWKGATDIEQSLGGLDTRWQSDVNDCHPPPHLCHSQTLRGGVVAPSIHVAWPLGRTRSHRQ